MTGVFVTVMAVFLIKPKILNNLSIPNLNYFKIRHFVQV